MPCLGEGRLNSAIGYITPKGMLAGHQQEIQAERDRKLETAKRTAEEPTPLGRVTRIPCELPTIRTESLLEAANAMLAI
jgi:hypothetical protein